MKKSKKPEVEWRQFEKLVAIIESHLGPKGAVVKSPDFLLDKITGESRQIDATVRYKVGSMPILISIECRDRKSIQDTTWIEQLAKKQEGTGANATIAVSSKKFSKPALAKAKFYGIETRLLTEVSEDSIRSWAEKLEAVLISGQFGLGALRIEYAQSNKDSHPELDSTVKFEREKGDVEYKFIRRSKDGQFISIGDLLRESEGDTANQRDNQNNENTITTINIPPKSVVTAILNDNFPSLFKDVPFDGTVVNKLFTSEFDSGEAEVQTKSGFAEIKRIEVELRIRYKAFPSNMGKLLSYSNDESSILNVEQRKITLANGKVIDMIISGYPENQ